MEAITEVEILKPSEGLDYRGHKPPKPPPQYPFMIIVL